jgi:type II secretory pathway pseudopilin PulG
MTSLAKKIIIGVAIAAVVGLVLIGILAGAAVSGWRAATRAGNEAATIQNLKTIAAVETQYFNTHNRTFGTFDQLVREQMLSSRFAGNPVVADDYVLILNVGAGRANPSYVVTADPQSDSSGRRHFYLDSTAEIIRSNADRHASADDPPFDK